MRCTNFEKIAGELSLKLHGELARAIEAHNGEYVFFDPEGEEEFDPLELPVVRATVGNFSEEQYCAVTKVVKGARYKNEVIVYGYPQLYDGSYMDDEYIIDLCDAGGRQAIIEAIPETETVKDVATPEPIISVSVLGVEREDIDAVGYDGDNIDDGQLLQIANRVIKYLSLDDYWECIRDACDYWDIPKLNKEENE